MKKYVLWGMTAICLSLSACTTTHSQSDTNNVWIPGYEGIWNTPPAHTPNNKVPDGAINGNGDIGFVLGGTPEESVFYFSKNDFWKAKKGYPDGGVCYVGELHISVPELKDASYLVHESIGDGTVRSTYTRKDGAALKMKSWCAASQNTTVLEMEAIKQPLTIDYSFIPGQGMGSQNSCGNEEDTEWFIRKFDSEDLEWPSAVAVAMTSSHGNDTHLNLKAGEKAYVLLSFCSNHDDSNYKKAAIQKVQNVRKEGIGGLYEKHKSWWTTFWQASRVELNDSLLEKYYYGSHYLLACCSRNPNFAPGLWGNSLTMDATANGWAGDYHTNYNHMAPWWGVYSSNHVELSDPFDTPILEYMPRAKEHAQQFLHKKGVYYPVGIGPKGFCSSMFPLTSEAMMKQYGTPEQNIEGGYMFLGQKSNAVFCTTNMFMRFYHTYDKAYAMKVYPFIREVADFWEDYLVYENGRYVSYNDSFWEVGPWEGKNWKQNYGDINPTVSLGLCRMLFKGIIEMSTFLQVDQDKVEKWNHILTHLSDIPTASIGGVTRIKACEGGNGSGSRTAPGLGRVMMHGLLFPSGVCGELTDSTFAQVLRDEIYRWETDTATHAEWHDARWDNLGNGIETYFTSAARVGYDGNKLLEHLKERIRKTAYPNLWIPQDGGGIESLSAVPSCINEMLLQGYEGTIRIFPVWPKEKEASFTRLRTHGAFLVSSACKDGEVSFVEIESEQGRPCSVLNPWPTSGCKITYSNGKEETVKGKILELKLGKGEGATLTKLQ